MKPVKILAIVLAAGASTRMRTKKSKLLHKILGRTLIEWSLEQASWFAKKIVFVVGHQKEELQKQLEDRKERLDVDVLFALQDKAKGTGHAVQCALPSLDNWTSDESLVFIMGGDTCLLKRDSADRFLADFEKSKAHLSFVSTRLDDPGAYGRVLRNSQGVVERIVEKKDASPEELLITEINVGFYLLRLGLLRAALKDLKPDNKAGEFYLTDLISYSRKQGLLVTTLKISEEESLGINTQQDLALCIQKMQSRINSWWMSQGVHLVEPSSVWIEADVEIASDVVIEPGVHLKGKTKIAAGCEIGPYSVIENSSLAGNTKVEAFCHLKEAKLGTEVHVGPYARLRPGAVLETKVHIGNFVEIKKSHLWEGVKVNHLSYVGDADIGRESNIGAGTITCNYDGYDKHRTKIGERVFIGSNTSLVAPVEVGAGAIVGAGSVITKNVSSEALAVERAEQREIQSGASRFRSKRVKK